MVKQHQDDGLFELQSPIVTDLDCVLRENAKHAYTTSSSLESEGKNGPNHGQSLVLDFSKEQTGMRTSWQSRLNQNMVFASNAMVNF